ncbi:MAG: hypothetical protein IT342_10485 [Candidatus Melainabacteria bacterium]|nr:hypothetical protein [Candidatus Melainabacteria bacterium]
MVFVLPFKKKMRLVIVFVLAGFVLTFEKSLSAQNRFSADKQVEIAKMQLDANDTQSSSSTCQRAIAMYKTFLS